MRKKTSEKKRERKEGENYKTENGGKLEIKERGKRDKERKKLSENEEKEKKKRDREIEARTERERKVEKRNRQNCRSILGLELRNNF